MKHNVDIYINALIPIEVEADDVREAVLTALSNIPNQKLNPLVQAGYVSVQDEFGNHLFGYEFDSFSKDNAYVTEGGVLIPTEDVPLYSLEMLKETF